MLSVTHVYIVKKWSAYDAEYHFSIFAFTGAVKENPYAGVCSDDAIAVVPWNHVTMVDLTDNGEKCNVL